MTKYCYARVSSKSQEDNSSLKGQKEQLIERGILEENILVDSFRGKNLSMRFKILGYLIDL